MTGKSEPQRENPSRNGKIRAASASERTCGLQHRMLPDGSLALPARTPLMVVIARDQPRLLDLCREQEKPGNSIPDFL